MRHLPASPEFPRHGGKQNVALKLGFKNASYISQLAGPNPTKEIKEDLARKIEDTFGLTPGAMDLPELGEGLARRVEEPGADYKALAVLDDKLLADVSRAVLTSARNRLNHDQLAEVIALVYRCAAPTSTVDVHLVDRLVTIIAR